MTEAEQARANAIPLEVKKDGLTQRQSGDWVLRLVVQAADMDQSIITAAMGTRFQAVLVEIDSDESPVRRDAKEKQAWRDMGATKQAALRCNDPVFWAFLNENNFDGIKGHVTDATDAADAVRMLCNIETRSDLDKPGFVEQRRVWYHLDNSFQAWRAAENG
jgi:hypothetical protein